MYDKSVLATAVIIGLTLLSAHPRLPIRVANLTAKTRRRTHSSRERR